MNRIRLTIALLAAAMAAPATCQEQAATMAALAQRADVVVRASVTYSTLPTPTWRQVGMRTDAVLKGQVGATFTLTEPAGECCGRSLFSLQAGDERLLFLRKVGPVLHPLGGGRGVLPATPALIAHTGALLQTETTNALGHLLAQSLASPEPRISHDAAMALAVLPNLSLSATDRAAALAALSQSVQRGSTRAAALADVAARLGDAVAVDAVLPLYLGATRDDQAALLRSALTRCAPALVAERMPMHVGTARRDAVRAATLLTALPPSVGQGAMAALLSRPVHPRAKVELCQGLLAAGVARASLRPMVPAVVLELAVRRREQGPTFENIRPRR